MQRSKTLGLVLRRTNFGESDRIVSILTQDFGRISVLAKGVRKPRSRLMGGIEAFTLSKYDFIPGKGNLARLVSAKPITRFENVIKDYDRLSLAGEMLGLINKSIEDDADKRFFDLAHELMLSLEDLAIEPVVIEIWFRLQLLRLLGREPQLLIDATGAKLSEGKSYHFDPSEGVFRVSDIGNFSKPEILVWRVLSLKTPRQTKQVVGLAAAAQPTLLPLQQFFADNSF